MLGPEYGLLHDLCRSYKTFDTVSRAEFWKIMAKFSCPAEVLINCGSSTMVCLQVSKVMASFLIPFPVTNGIKQSCVLASTLFIVVFSVMITGAFQDGDNAISIRYGFDGKIFNLRRLQAKSKGRQKC